MRNILAPVATALLTAAGASQSKTIPFEFSGQQEVPPVQTNGIGNGFVTVDTTTGMVTVRGRYALLSGNATACHLHGNAQRGFNAGVGLVLTVSGGTSGTISGSGTLNPAQLLDLLDGAMYVNLHTTVNPGGELRAQLDHVPDSGTGIGQAGPAISGAATGGGTLRVDCPPATPLAFILVGLPLPPCQTVSLPQPIACLTPTELVFDPLVPLVAISGASASIPIPNGVRTVHVAIQCLFFDTAANCLRLSGGNRVLIR